MDEGQLLFERSLQAIRCNFCFDRIEPKDWSSLPTRPADRPDALPVIPYVGSHYWDSERRVAVVMLNPGARAAKHKLIRRDLGKQLRDGAISYDVYMQQLGELLPQWGFGGVVRWIEAVGLRPEDIAFLNLALRAVDRDRYFSGLFDECFHRHTRELIKTLDPAVVLLCGKKHLARFAPQIQADGFEAIVTWHYRPMHTSNGQRELARVCDTLKQH